MSRAGWLGSRERSKSTVPERVSAPMTVFPRVPTQPSFGPSRRSGDRPLVPVGAASCPRREVDRQGVARSLDEEDVGRVGQVWMVVCRQTARVGDQRLPRGPCHLPREGEVLGQAAPVLQAGCRRGHAEVAQEGRAAGKAGGDHGRAPPASDGAGRAARWSAATSSPRATAAATAAAATSRRLRCVAISAASGIRPGTATSPRGGPCRYRPPRLPGPCRRSRKRRRRRCSPCPPGTTSW